MTIGQPLLTNEPIVRNSTDERPSTVDDSGSLLAVGQELYLQDVGLRYFWDGTKWVASDEISKLVQIVELLKEIRDLLS